MSITNQKGDIGEAAFVFEAAKKGYWTAKMPQDCPYDYILDKKDGRILRIQVKYRAVNSSGTILVKLVQRKEYCKANRRSYNATNIDAMAIYISDHNKTYLVPIAEMPDMDEVTFRCRPTKNNQVANVRMIDEYEHW